MQLPIQYGIDTFLQRVDDFKNKRIGLVTNNAATTSTGILSRVALLNEGFLITKLFSPEHGITCKGIDGEAQYNQTDILTQLPVISLYGEKLAPGKEDLSDIDLVLFDIPDIGCRFYTYLWTMTYIMEACAQYQIPLIILDRPSPIGAILNLAEGPLLDEKYCSSFIGRWSIPVTHSCTLGELAQYFAATKIMHLNLQVIKVNNYQRHFTAQHDFAFVPTSPAIKTADTALLYPGMGLLEGINIDEGRGTASPFTTFGAPFIDENIFLDNWLLKKIPGIIAVETIYKPESGLYAGEVCHGLEFIVTNYSILKPVQLGISLIQTLLKLYPQYITERLYPTAANPSGKGHLDKLLGIPNAIPALKNNRLPPLNVNPWWQNTINPYLLYS